MLKLIALCSAGLLLSACASHSATDDSSPTVSVSMQTTAGEIVLELDREHAPLSVANFLDHAAKGHYDGTVFHRVIPAFVVQGGGWTPEFVERAKLDAAAGHPDVPIKNEWQNGLKNLKGTIAMAREAAPDTATREFYINVADNAKLDTAREKAGNAGYAVFGRVVRGMDVIETIRTGATGPRSDIKVDDGSMNDVPIMPVVITHVRRVR